LDSKARIYLGATSREKGKRDQSGRAAGCGNLLRRQALNGGYQMAGISLPTRPVAIGSFSSEKNFNLIRFDLIITH